MSDQNQQAVILRIRKLLALSENNSNEHEATAAAAKAQELLTEYGIEMLAVQNVRDPKGGKRSDTKMKGGLYKWQRELWDAVAKLNFCMYWSHKGLTRGSTYEHRLLGSEVNVISTQVMAEYLQQTIERMARERVNFDGSRYFIKENIEYREGVAKRVGERLTSMRYKREQEARAKKANGATANALTILNVIDAENDANMDHLYGEGYSANMRAQQAKWSAEFAEKQAADKKWREENPEEAAARDAAEQKANEEWLKKNKHRFRERKAKVVYKSQAYLDGLAHGDTISLNQQVDEQKTRRIK